MSLPTNVGSGRIVGRFVVGIIDSPDDLDDDPELIPAQGTITFTPSIGYVPNSTTEIPMTIMKAPITGVLDSEGYLCTPDNSSTIGGLTRGVKLFATDVGQVTGWTYTVKYSFTPVGTVVPHIPEHPLTVPDESTQDLTKVAPTPFAPVIGIPQMEASVLRAESVAQSVRDDADAGVFDGEKGDVGPMGPPVALEIGTVTASAGNPADDDIMSTLILSGTKTKAAIKAQIPIEQIGEQGPKGDPGGLVLGTVIPLGTDLNTLLAPGTYRMLGSSAVNAPTQLDQQWYSLLVLATENNRVQQILYPSATGQMGRIFYMRATATGAGSFQSEWFEYPSTKVDRTAGKAIYTWDSTTKEFALTSGDTGLRDITGELVNGWTVGEAGWVRVRRYGGTVTYYIKHLIPPTTGSAIFWNNIPLGFMSNLSATYRGVIPVSSTAMAVCSYRRFEQDIQIPLNAGTIGSKYDVCSVSFEVDSAWPTTLPGTPV